MCTCDYAVDPAARGHGLRLKVAAVGRAALSFSTSSNASAGTVLRALGGASVDAARDTFVFPLRIGAFLAGRMPAVHARGIGAVADRVVAAGRAVGARPRRGTEIRGISEFGPEFDRLWDRVAARHAVQVVRDAAYLQWRYRRCPYGSPWAAAVVRDDEVRGLVVVGTATSSDVSARPTAGLLELFDDGVVPGARRALLAAGMRYAAGTGAEVMAARAGDPALARLLRTAGFRVRRRDSSPVTYRAGEADLEPFLATDHGWHLSFGDGDAWDRVELGAEVAR
ncbi:hypothetical protein [Pseudonocardia nigra]|uniref:hypothetical protein n=1 Tax=Pseudonocardia nigra TaxID=1921578 RepID=UPI001C5F8BCB|nr:hypothetical protein [Pseudonocardia nigra]